MKRGLKIVGILVLGLVLVTVWWKAQFPSTSWRYKITIEIETPEGIKSGAAVREVRAWKNAAKLINPDVAPIEYEVIGEAVVVDLGKRGVLFGLIDWDSYEEVESSFPEIASNVSEYLEYYERLESGSRSTLRNNQPKIVTFDNIEDPRTAKLVYERKLYGNGQVDVNNFQNIFGKGIDLKQITIEISENPVSSGIEKKLPFLNSPEKFIEWRRSLKYGDPLIMDRSNFIRKGQ